ncbi:MAG: SGNH/GDSL hydrolase family protein [Bacteroidetes bacterium]|nr:SGNH/GDSL hydrolase family protein [Bacteroidota bacterium]
MENIKKQPTFWSNVKALFFGLLVALFLIELILRIFHPFPFRVKHGKIILPANQHIVHKNPHSNKLEPVIYYSRNSLGLRGEEMPKDPAKWIKIITIGGSTTECSYNSDSLTWPELLKTDLRKEVAPNIWLDNAGLDGTSTFGHIVLLQDHIVALHPDYVIFLTGVNDMEEKAMGGFDTYHTNELDKRSFKDYMRSLIRKTEIGSLLENIYRYRIAYEKGLVHREVNYAKEPKLSIDSIMVAKQITTQQPYLLSYQKRILTLDSICRANHIKAIFLTQPSLFASFKDPATGLDFTDIQVSPGRNASLQGKILDEYNNVLLQLKESHHLNVVNLAAAMPHDSRYYYDYTHYTSIGTPAVARIVADSVRQYFK